ncbi:MAG TPA: DUF885 domain-containing protein [Thermoanaerobaculia bacterium]|nr:DUF885 domain-containing protein [Thermoanaerobaculia bacterium]
MRKVTIFLAMILVASAAFADEAETLRRLFDEDWEWQLRDNPESATSLGDKRYDDRLTDRSSDAWARRREHANDMLSRIQAIDRTKLRAADQLNYDLFLYQARQAADGVRFPAELPAIDQMGGIYQTLGELAQQMPRDTVKDYENFIARLHAYPRAVDQTIDLLQRGINSGVTPPRVIVRPVAQNIANQIVDDPEQSPIYELAFAKASVPDQARLRKEALDALRTDVLPALKKLQKFWNEEYFAHTRENIGWTSVPQGREWYAYRVRVETTSDLTPDQIHELGLSEVKRIREEMEKVKTLTGFKGTLPEFFTFLRSDPRFYYDTRDALLLGYRDIAKRIDPELPRLFGRLPRLPYGVTPIPAYSEKTQTTAYYNAGAPEAHRPGYYYVNLYDLKSRPKWEMEALSLHESVPGHHLQIALAQELPDVPKFRRYGGYTAFVEGWALYGESLGPELGMYTDPYSRFGQLTYEMWRAVRLVVDTGMHAKGWTRQQAIDFFVANSSKPLHDIEVEIDRYLAWPAQALGYKLGELKIKELRARAERELGPKFDIRAFHDEILGAGPLPLSMLEQRITAWIGERKGS